MKKIILCMCLCLISGATAFALGGPEVDITEHEAVFKEFAIARTELTNAEAVPLINKAIDDGIFFVYNKKTVNFTSEQFGKIALFLNGDEMQATADGTKVEVVTGRENYPARYISWYGALTLCNARSELEGLRKAYNQTELTEVADANGYRLPSPEEWEFAASGGDDRIFSWGNELGDGNIADATYKESYKLLGYDEYDDGYVGAWPATMGGQNPFGLYNMCGNALEWTSELMEMPGDDEPWAVAKGGSFESIKKQLNIYHDTGANLLALNNRIGFRMARTNLVK